ncbi:hypothetical protein Goshw_021839 [Gossypium schwendimanii]|uniref:Uncharacterized protein n=1 Tax=Gossypium schwendimanii TaxID=34291 RepID=A0A7J9L532_GOSSC|nr:hypothetical protein [Gossypium schwendimanii]
MENGGILLEKQVIDVYETNKPKPPTTRLQKHAPAPLQLSQMKPNTTVIEKGATPIPLLTPLASSPSPFLETQESVFPIDDHMEPVVQAPMGTAIGWRNLPVGSGYAEPSTLFFLFQNKFLLVNDAQ